MIVVEQGRSFALVQRFIKELSAFVYQRPMEELVPETSKPI